MVNLWASQVKCFFLNPLVIITKVVEYGTAHFQRVQNARLFYKLAKLEVAVLFGCNKLNFR